MPVSSVSVNREPAPFLPAIQQAPSPRRLLLALGCSLVLHGVLLCLQFGIPGFGLPGLSLPWSSRAQPIPPLTLRLLPTAPPPVATVADTDAAGVPAPTLSSTVAPHSMPAPALADHASSPAATRNSVALSRAPDTAAPQAPPSTSTLTTTVIAMAPLAPVEFIVPPAPALRNSAPADIAVLPVSQAAPVNVEAAKAAPEAKSRAVSLASVALPSPAPVAAPASSLAPVFQAQAQAAPEPNAGAGQRRAQLQAEQAQAAHALAVAEIQQAQQSAQQQAQEQAAMQARQWQQAQLAQQQVEDAMQRQHAAQAAKAQQEAAQRARMAEEQAAQQAQQLAQQQIQQQIQQQAQQLQQQLELQQQAEQARQQAAALALQQAQQRQAAEQLEQAQRQQAQLAAQQNEMAQQRAQEAARRQQAEAVAQQQARDAAQQAAQQREQNAPVTVAAAAPDQSRAPGAATPAWSGAGDFTSRALAQARTLDFRQLQTSAVPTPPAQQARRYSIFGSVDNDVGLALYMQSWRLKIERNGSVNYSRPARRDIRIEPLVTVSIRSDGSVEEVLLNRSSGDAELDQAVRRIVRLNARYSAFPPALARKYDVIEIRRIWRFDDVLTLLDEVR